MARHLSPVMTMPPAPPRPPPAPPAARRISARLLPVLGLLMVSRVPYGHAFSALVAARGRWAMVRLVVLLLVLYVAPVPTLFALGWLYFGNGLLKAARGGARGPVVTGREAA